jgi:hypothetical protein
MIEQRRRVDAHWTIVSPTIKVGANPHRVDDGINGPVQLRRFAIATSKGVNGHGQQQT